MRKTTEEHQEIILREMCNRVGADYEVMRPKMSDKNSEWYTEYSWTREEEKDFEQWLATYMKTNSLARGGVMASMQAQMFILNYGWKTAEKTQEAKS